MAAVVVLGVFQLGLAYVLLTKGLETTPAITASLVTGIEPILNPLWVAIFYKEVFTPMAMAGASASTLTLVWVTASVI